LLVRLAGRGVAFDRPLRPLGVAARRDRAEQGARVHLRDGDDAIGTT
jgi:hypothetical protein